MPPAHQALARDLLVHDRRRIRSAPDEAFIHVTYRNGTNLLPLITQEKFPAEGVIVPYLFGHADRQHILSQASEMMNYYADHHVDGLFHYFDGKRLRTITIPAAKEVVRRYTEAIKNQWHLERHGIRHAA